MANVNEAGQKRRVSIKTALIAIIILLSVIASGYALVTISRTFEIRPSNFVTLPTSPVSKTGEVVVLDSVAPITQGSVAMGVKGYLETASGQPVSGANVYVQYYLEGSYRTQVETTDQNGYFEIHFPMNWTGWLPLTMIYFGDAQHQGVRQIVSLTGENL
jgi:hypothetical protein